MGDITKKEVVEMLGLESKGSVDYALPQNWVDDFVKLTGKSPISCFVWFYSNENPGGFSGYPHPLTVEAKELLARYNLLARTSYPIPEYPKAYVIEATVTSYKG